MMLGGPFILALAPIATLQFSKYSKIGVLLFVSGVYYVAWFLLINQQVRFLMPIMAPVMIVVAIGIKQVLEFSLEFKCARLLITPALIILIADQILFVGHYQQWDRT